MIKRKTKGTVISICVLVVVILLVVGIVFIKIPNTEKSKTDIGENLDNNVTDIANPENLAINENISEEETQAITDYINRVCNVIFERLPEFNNINDADKEWIYLHLTIEKDDGFATEEEINNDLQSFFGKELICDVKNDQKLIPEDIFSFIPRYSEEYGKYSLVATGTDNSVYYAIDTIKKINENYVINVVEFNKSYDMLNDEEGKVSIISTYDESINSYWKWREVFKINSSELIPSSEKLWPSPTLVEEVLKRKNEFVSYTITIEKNSDGVFIVKSIER